MKREYIRQTEFINAYIIAYTESTIFNRGYGCGYVEIKKDHPVYKLAKIEQIYNESSFYFQLPLIGEEITFCEFKDNVLTLGFDSSHSYNNIENSNREKIKESTYKMYEQCRVYNDHDVESEKIKKINELKNLLNKI